MAPSVRNPAREIPTNAVEELRATLRERFGPQVEPERPDLDNVGATRPLGVDPVPSGWTVVDRALDGGLRAGRTMLVEGSPGAGSLALASGWAREVCRRGEPVLVLDVEVLDGALALPHAWIEPEDGRAPLWILHVGEREVWAALDIALRSHAFGMAIVLEPPSAPTGVGPRILRHAREGGTRLLHTQSSLHPRASPWAPDHRIRLEAGMVRWVDGPVGAAPLDRLLEVSGGDGRSSPRPLGREARDDASTDRMRPAPRAPDRRPPSGRGGRSRRTG